MPLTFKLLALLGLSVLCAASKRLSMKVVEAPTNLNVQAMYQPRASAGIKARVNPTNFSGPAHLRYLLGRCYTKVTGDYSYELCPYNNITQRELTLRWNSYHGVLGVWRDWTIKNNTFIAMNMMDGDSCGTGGGSIYRSARVLFRCGNKTELYDISEPSTCQYELILSTPLTCHPDSLLVYPTLSDKLQGNWDDIEMELAEGDITDWGYQRRLDTLFTRAGLVIDSETVWHEQQENERRKKEEHGQFDTLSECQTEYLKLRTEIVRLKRLLNECSASNSTLT